MKDVQVPAGFVLASLDRKHPRKAFDCGDAAVNQWLTAKALQGQQKHLSVTKVLLDPQGQIAGYYTLATGHVDFGELPAASAKGLPKRLLPIAILAWLGVSLQHQGQGLGRRLLARALRDCYEAGQTFPFIAVVLDCLNDEAKAFYQQWDFEAMPGNPYRLFLSATKLALLLAAN